MCDLNERIAALKTCRYCKACEAITNHYIIGKTWICKAERGSVGHCGQSNGETETLEDRTGVLVYLDSRRTPGNWISYNPAGYGYVIEATEQKFPNGDAKIVAKSMDGPDAAYLLAMPEAMAVIRELAAEVERLRGIIEFNGLSGEL